MNQRRPDIGFLLQLFVWIWNFLTVAGALVGAFGVVAFTNADIRAAFDGLPAGPLHLSEGSAAATLVAGVVITSVGVLTRYFRHRGDDSVRATEPRSVLWLLGGLPVLWYAEKLPAHASAAADPNVAHWTLLAAALICFGIGFLGACRYMLRDPATADAAESSDNRDAERPLSWTGLLVATAVLIYQLPGMAGLVHSATIRMSNGWDELGRILYWTVFLTGVPVLGYLKYTTLRRRGYGLENLPSDAWHWIGAIAAFCAVHATTIPLTPYNPTLLVATLVRTVGGLAAAGYVLIVARWIYVSFTTDLGDLETST